MNINGLNGFDYVAITLFTFGAIYGLQRGALRMVTSVVALVAAIYFAALYYTRAGAFAETQLGTSQTVGAAIGFVAVFTLIFAAIELIGSSAIRLTQVAHLSPLESIGRRPARRRIHGDICGLRCDAAGGRDAGQRSNSARLETGADAAGVQRDAGGIHPG